MSDPVKPVNIWRHNRNRKLYRTVGSCIDKERDEYCVLYRLWDDFSDQTPYMAQPTLYCRSWKNFREKFTPYEYSELKVVPTTEQLLKDLKKT